MTIGLLTLSLAIMVYPAVKQTSSVEDILKIVEVKITAAVAAIEQRPGKL